MMMKQPSAIIIHIKVRRQTNLAEIGETSDLPPLCLGPGQSR